MFNFHLFKILCRQKYVIHTSNIYLIITQILQIFHNKIMLYIYWILQGESLV